MNRMMPRVVRVSENQPLPPDIQALLFQKGTLEVFPEVVASRFLAMSLTQGRPVVRTTNFVGVLPLNSRLTLEVEPKVPVASVASMLAHSSEDIILFGGKSLHEFDSTDVIVRQLLELLASQFLESLERLVAGGLAKEYARIDSLSETVRGAVRFTPTVRARARNQPLLIGTRRFERTAHTSTNGALQSTIEFVARTLRSSSRSPKTATLIAACNRLSRHFPRPSRSTTASETRRSIRGLLNSHVGQDYARALRLGEVLLSGAGIEVAPVAKGIQSQCFMLSLDLIFEDYVRSVLRAGLSDLQVKGAKKFPPHGARRLLLSHGTARSEAEPDIVVEAQDGHPMLVLDAKYKSPQRPIERADLNQVVAYGAAYGVGTVGLVTPTANPSGTVAVLGHAGALRVLHVQVDLFNADRAAAESKFVSDIRNFVVSPASTHPISTASKSSSVG